MRSITVKILAGEKSCDNCRFLQIMRTGLAGEFHPRCLLFDKNGGWGKTNMRRDEKCLRADQGKVKP